MKQFKRSRKLPPKPTIKARDLRIWYAIKVGRKPVDVADDHGISKGRVAAIAWRVREQFKYGRYWREPLRKVYVP